MERKLIKQGLGGYTIYLPKKWISERGLKEGDSVKIEEQGINLIVGGSGSKASSIELDLDEDTRADLPHILTHLYRIGLDKITLRKSRPSDTKEVRKIVSSLLLGFEITGSTDLIVIENVSESNEDKYPMMIRRIFLILQEQHKFSESAVQNADFKEMDEMNSLRLDLDKFILFCRRLLTKHKAGTFPTFEWELLTFLMHIGHAYYYMYEYCSKNKISKDKHLNSLMEKLGEYLEKYVQAFNTKDSKYIHYLNNEKNKLHFTVCLNLLTNSRGTETILISYIREIFRQIQIGTSPLLSILLSSQFKNKN